MSADELSGSERILSIPTTPGQIPRIPDHPHPEQVQAEVRFPKPPREKPPITDKEPRVKLNLPISDERMLELRRRLGLTVPVTQEDGLTDIQLRATPDGGYVFAVPPTYPVEGPLRQRVQARQFVRPTAVAGGEAWFFSLTIPQLDGAREVIRFPKVEGAENALGAREAAALEALLNRPETRGAVGLKRVIGSVVRRFMGPAAALIGALALRGDSLPPVHVAAETFTDPVGVVEPDRRAPHVDVIMPSDQVDQPDAEGHFEQPDDVDDISIELIIEPGGSRWTAIEKYLTETHGLSGQKLVDMTKLLVYLDRAESGVDEEMARHDKPGAPVEVPSPRSLRTIFEVYDTDGPAVAAQALAAVMNPPRTPHNFAGPGADAEAVQDLEKILADLEAQPIDSDATDVAVQ